MKLNKKILISLFSLFGVAAITAPFLVSCSNSAAQIQTITTKTGGDFTFTIANGIVCDPGFSIGEDTFKSPPGFDKKDFTKQQATAVFDVIGAFSQWIYGASNSIATVISRQPTTKNESNPIEIPSITEGTLDYALAAYIGSGKGTYRLGIKNITSSITPQTIYENVIQYVEPNESNIADPNVIPYEEGSNPNTNQLSFGDVTLTFSWWRSEGSGKIKWMSDAEFNNLTEKNYPDYIKNAEVPPEFEYTLTIRGIMADINTYAIQEINKQKYWFPTGQIRINSETNDDKKSASPFFTQRMSCFEVQALLDTIDKANKVAAGDYTNQNFSDFIQTDEGKRIKDQLPLLVS